MRPTTIFFLGLLLIGMSTGATAQNAPVWTSDFPNKADFLKYSDPQGEWLIGTTQMNACVLNGNTGQVMWSETFSNLIGSKKVDIQYVMENAGVLFLYDKKGGKDNLSCIDLFTGKLLWQTDRFEGIRLSGVIYMPDLKSFVLAAKDGFYMMDARTGEVKWAVDRFRGAVAAAQYDADNNEVVVLNYKTSWGALLSGYKNQLMAIDVKSGTVKWETEYFGVIHNKPYSGGLVFNWHLYPDKILLMVQGLQVIDRKTGKELWRTDYDLFDSKVGLGSSSYVYNGIAYPLVKDDAIYLVYNKPASGKVLLQKLDFNTGNVSWEVKLDGKNPAIPSLELAGNKLVAQVGGMVTIEGTDDNGSFRKTRWDGPFGVMVLDPSNGKVLWQNYDLKKRSTSPVIEGNKIYIADEKALYTLDLNSGSELAAVNIKDLKVGAPQWLGRHDNRLMFQGEDGLALLDVASGGIVGSVPAKETYWSSDRDHEYYFLEGDKNIQYVRLSDANIMMTVKHEKGLRFITSRNGETIFLITKKGVSRYNLNGSATGNR